MVINERGCKKVKYIKYVLGLTSLLVILFIEAQLPASAATFPAQGLIADTDGDMGEISGNFIFNWSKSDWYDEEDNPGNDPMQFKLFLNNGSTKPFKTYTGYRHNDYRFVYTIPKNTKLPKNETLYFRTYYARDNSGKYYESSYDPYKYPVIDNINNEKLTRSASVKFPEGFNVRINPRKTISMISHDRSFKVFISYADKNGKTIEKLGVMSVTFKNKVIRMPKLPAKAKSLKIFAIEGNRISKDPIVVPLSNTAKIMENYPKNRSFKDINKEAGIYAGKFKWDGMGNEDKFSKYTIYSFEPPRVTTNLWRAAANNLVKLGEVKATGKKRYQFTLPPTKKPYLKLVILPEIKGQYISALDVDIHETNKYYNQRIRRYKVTDNYSSTKENLTLTKNMLYYLDKTNFLGFQIPEDQYFPITLKLYDSKEGTEPFQTFTQKPKDKYYLGSTRFPLAIKSKDLYVEFTNKLGHTSNRIHYKVDPKETQVTPKLTSKDVVFFNRKNQSDYILVKNVTRGDVIYAGYGRAEVRREQIRKDGSFKITTSLDDNGGTLNIKYERNGYFTSEEAAIPYGKAK